MSKLSMEERLKYVLDHNDVDLPDLTREQKATMIKGMLEEVDYEYTSYAKANPEDFGDERIDEIVRGTVDTHCHGGSDPLARLLLENQIALDYTQIGAKAVVIKTHYTPSASRVPLVQGYIDKWAKERGVEPVRVLGGICLNKSVGGLNPDAVRWVARFPGCRYVWLASMDAYDHRIIISGEDFKTAEATGVRVVDKEGEVVPELREILKIIAERDMVLATGHYVHATRKKVIEAARDAGVERVEVQHVQPTFHAAGATIQMMREYLGMGVRNLKLGMTALIAAGPIVGPEGRSYPFKVMKEVGPEHFVFGTDYGQIFNPPHTVGIRWFAKNGIFFGFSPSDLVQVMQRSGAELLGLG